MTLRSAELHYKEQAALAVLVERRVRQLWVKVTPSDVNAWRSLLPQALGLVTAAQFRAAQSADAYVSDALTEQGAQVTPDARVAPAAFAGVASDGRPLTSLLDQPRISALTAIGGGMSAADALQSAGSLLVTMAVTQVQDAGRQADSVAIFTRPTVGWVRMVNPPCCSRCAILAGARFKSNQGFQRHPRCDCRHVPAAEASPDDIGTSLSALFSNPERVTGLNKADWRALKDGADPIAVVNARRVVVGRDGSYRSVRSKDKMTTTESTTRRGRGRGRGPRLTPDGIYARTGGDREQALTLLRQHGYIR